MRTLLRILLFAALAGAIVHQMDMRAIAGHFSTNLLWALLASQPLIVLSFIAFAARLRAILPAPALPGATAFSAVILPVGLNAVLPARLSEFVKPVYLRRKVGLPLQQGISCVMIERLFDVIVVGLLGAGVLPALVIPQPPTLALVGVVAAAAAVPYVLVLFMRHLPRWAARLPNFARTQCEALADIHARGRYLRLALLSFAGWTCSALSVHVCLVLAGSVSLDPFDSAAVFILTLIGGMIAILPAGVGTFQAAALIGLVALGFSREESLVLGILLQVSALLFASLASLVLVLVADFSLRELSRLPLRKST